MAESRTIGVFGAGWVGLVTGGCFAELGHEVTVRDVVPERIDALSAGRLPFHEPDLPEVLARNRDRIRYTLDADDLIEADVIFLCVQTPPTYSGDADLSFVWTALDDLPRVERRQILVMKSTVPVGTGEKVRAALEARGLTNVGYVSNPEFLAEGTAVRDFMNPDRIVIGAADPQDAAFVEALYSGIETPIVRTDVASAEMIKLAANAFLSTRISFINEIANVCELVGADVESVAQGAGLDHRLGAHFLRAGVGWRGRCRRWEGASSSRRRKYARLWPGRSSSTVATFTIPKRRDAPALRTTASAGLVRRSKGCPKRLSGRPRSPLSGGHPPRGRAGDSARGRRARPSEGARPDRGASARGVPGLAARAGGCRARDRQLRGGSGRALRGEAVRPRRGDHRSRRTRAARAGRRIALRGGAP